MTTDTKAVAWTVVNGSGESSIGGWSDMRHFEQSKKIASVREGHRYAFAISMDDHERVVGELEERLQSFICEAELLFYEQRAELYVLNEAQAVGDGTVSGSLLHWHQRALAAEVALAASRAEVEGMVLIQISDAKSLINYVTHSPASKMASHRVRALIEMKENGNV